MTALLSHPAESGLKEKKLTEHLLNVASEIEKQIADKTLKLKLIDKKKLIRLGRIIGLMHDFGKGTVFFQKYLKGESKRSHLTNHSLISAAACFCILKQEFKNEPLNELWAYIGFQVVYRHHGNLVAFDMQDHSCNFGPCKDQLKNLIDNNWDEFVKFYSEHKLDISIIKKIPFKMISEFLSDETAYLVEDTISSEEDKIEFFFIVNMLFSVLIDSDKRDAARLLNTSYFNGNLDEETLDVSLFLQKCRQENPEKFDPEKPINDIRNRFLNDIESNTEISATNHFYSITAPTGIGKTFGCMAFSSKLKKLLPNGSGRIIYCLPYTSIIDQNYEEFEKIVQETNYSYKKRPSRYLLKHHCLTEKKIKNRLDEEYSYKDYMDDRLLVESWQSSIIVTTFIQLFHTIIGNNNRFLKKFHNIINSIVILDEVQNIDPDFFNLIQAALKILGERFNTYFVLVTATQPKIIKSRDIIPLIGDDRYMEADLFNRVRLTVKPEPITIDLFCSDFLASFTGKNCLIVVNTINFAQQIYNQLNDNFSENEIYCLTTRLTPIDRKNQITIIKSRLEEGKKTIVVSTQLIEAGVDLSFKTVYRDFGPIDSIIQVAGRCNRHGEFGILGGNMILVNMENSGIYKQILMQYVGETLKENVYESKDFTNLSKDYFERFSFTQHSNKILAAIFNLNYDQRIEDQIPISDFALIDESLFNKRIFILHTHDSQKDMQKLINLLDQIKTEKLSKPEKEKILIEIEQCKYRLNQFSITAPEKMISNYSCIVEPYGKDFKKNKFPYMFISYKNQKEYAYDSRLGFLAEPKSIISNTLDF